MSDENRVCGICGTTTSLGVGCIACGHSLERVEDVGEFDVDFSDGSDIRFELAVDIVLVIDMADSMSSFRSMLKEAIPTLNDQLRQAMHVKDKVVSALRMRVVTFSDHYFLGNVPVADSDFHDPAVAAVSLQGQVDGFNSGRQPPGSLDALAAAMRSDWERSSRFPRRRHIIVVFADASPPRAQVCADGFASYSEGFHGDVFDSLTDLWDDPQHALMEYNSKRMIVYAPECYPWNVISANWENVLHYWRPDFQGADRITWAQVVDAISGSI